MRYEVTGTMKFRFTVEVDANSEDDAEEMMKDIDLSVLIEKSHEPYVDIDDVTEIKKTA
jgi:hypothetical protein